ncbi:trpp-9 [Pristionchus pacificus]|nr:trpp-9 [Pristionchus pacificus]
MDATVLPAADERARITVLVRPLGARQPPLFNRIVERLSRQRALLVSDNPRRVLQANFISAVNPDLAKFGELQTHRKVFAVVGVACSSAIDGGRRSISEEPSTPNASTTAEATAAAAVTSLPRRLPLLQGDAAVEQLEEIHAQYKTLKAEHSATVVDSRCVLIGYDETATKRVFSARETLAFTGMDESSELEHGIRELLRAVYTVMESRRVEGNMSAGKAVDGSMPCPLLPEEERTRVGVENRESKTYKRKVAGRLRKQVADLALLGGLPRDALEAYGAAIEQLKLANDHLWLAGAYEGWAVAAMAVRHSDPVAALRDVPALNGLHRVSSMTPDQIRQASGEMRAGAGGKENGEITEDSNHLSAPSSSSYLGHHRYRSDEGGKLALSNHSSAPPEGEKREGAGGGGGGTGGKKSKMPWAALKKDRRDADAEEIVEKVELALENYSKFSFAALVEYECMMVAVESYGMERNYISMEQLHREKVGKYLDDSFTRFDHYTKATICAHSALLYKKIGFRRKHAFFSRLGVLFRLHMEESSQRTPTDYRGVYPTLYKTLGGYGIAERAEPSSGPFCSEAVAAGPVQLQIKALHEVFTSATRAHYYEAAIRHCCYLLQVYYDHMDASMVGRLFVDLETLVRQRANTTSGTASSPALHHLGQHLSLECGGIILPPVQMTRFPMISDAVLCPLPSHLAPRVIAAPSSDGPSIFIYSPFQTKSDDASPAWVVDCACSISVLVYNCRPTELSVDELVLITEGVSFEPVPVRMTLPPASEGAAPARIKLIGVPRSAGVLTISGYSCTVFGVRNVCRLQQAGGSTGSKTPLQVQILPSLPLMTFDTTLPRAPINADDDATEQPTIAELKVYSGQTFDHALTVLNSSATMNIRNVRLAVQQPKVAGGPSLIEVIREEVEEEVKEETADSDDSAAVRLRSGGNMDDRPFDLSPRESRRIQLKIFGIDPTTTTDDGEGGGAVDNSARQSRASGMDWQTGSQQLQHQCVSTTGEEGGTQHDLIPYTGRLLVAELLFTYEADLEGPQGEHYSRSGCFRLLVSIVPALSVSSWSVLPGDGPFSRYIVVDVSNSSDSDAELVYASTKSISVQPRETCRVPLLSECCLEVGGRAFHAAAQCDSHHMQRVEIERLRRRLEEHVARHLDIRWTIPSYELEGLVPVGALLSSVALLKQLVLPALSLTLSVDNSGTQTETDVSVRIGELIEMRVDVVSSLDYVLPGALVLNCYQEISPPSSNPAAAAAAAENKRPLQTPLDRPGAIVCTGAKQVPFQLAPMVSRASSSVPPPPSLSAHFHFFFRAEGQYKIRPVVVQDATRPQRGQSLLLADDEIFVTPITFNVVTKGVR